MPKLNSRVAIVASGAIAAFLRPHLRQHLAYDASPALVGVTNAASLRQMAPAIVEKIKADTSGRLKPGARPEGADLASLLHGLAMDLAMDEEPAGKTPANPGLPPDRDRTTPSRDSIRKRLGTDKAKRAFDDLSDAELQDLIQSLGEQGNDEINPANPGTGTPDDSDHPLKSFLSERLGPADLAQACELLDKAVGDDPENVDEQAATELLDFLALRLNNADLQKASTMLVGPPSGDPAEEAEPGEDEPTQLDATSTPRLPGGSMDARRKVAKDERLRRARVLAMDALARRDAAGRATFAKMFPSALPGRSLDGGEQVHRPPRDTSTAAERIQADFRKRFPVRNI